LAKEGYGGIISARSLSVIEFIVNHSGEGGLDFLLQFHRPGADASWGLVGAKSGELYQGRPLESIPWTSGSMQNNIKGLAVEWEGRAAHGPLTPAQVVTARRLYSWCMQVPLANLGLPELGKGFAEHRLLTGGATSCPGERIAPLYASYKEEDMSLNDDDKKWLREVIEFRTNKAIKDSGVMAAISRLDAKLDKLNETSTGGQHGHD